MTTTKDKDSNNDDTVLKDKHEAFRNRLVDDVLGKTGDKVPMEKVVMLIWQFRYDPSVVTFMARFVAKYAGSRDVFDGIEFYLPQLVHMIIHLEAEWDDAVLERFALVIAQQSVHFALQLNWILQGALQDYQPENEDGTPNPNYNPLFYMRCLKLVKNVERCVVYGKPRAQELQRLYEKGKITKKELTILEQADRRFNALQITNAEDSDHSTSRLEGWMLVQRPIKKSEAGSSRKRMENRFCALERHVLNVYKTKCCYSKLVLERAMSLDKATILSTDDTSIRIETANLVTSLQFPSTEEKNLWNRRMSEESAACGLFQSMHLQESSIKKDLTPAQLNRYEFFQSERDFVNDLTEIAEDLRFEERANRKKLAPGKVAELNIPPNTYLPLCNSTDIWRRVSDKLADETRVFNTKERCPVVMHFISRRGEPNEQGYRIDPNVDVAEYMHIHFDVKRETETETEAAQIEEGDEAEEDGGEGQEVKVEDTAPGNSKNKNHDPLKLSEHGSALSGGVSAVWDEDDVEDMQVSHSAVSASPTSNKGAPGSAQKIRGNKRVQRLLRESVVTIPQILSKRMKAGNLKAATHGSRKRIVGSVMDRQTELQPLVPILEGTDKPHGATDDDGSVVSVERSSVLVNDHIVMPTDDGDIDADSINRATEFVGGGKRWAQSSADMLESARKKSEEEGEKVQLEIASCLAKSNDDLRQEVFIMQMIHYFKSVFAQAKLPIWLKTYRILSTSSSTGLLELLTDATSIDALKKSEGFPSKKEGGLRKYFELVYGGPDSKAFRAAQANFMQSLVGYSLVSYLLGLKDRHNGNIMIDTCGHLIFIDFGFAMGMKPGHEFSFEQAPFKLTNEYVEVMDGVGSACYKEFQRLFVAGFQEARKNSQIALGLVEIMMFKSNYPCFTGWRYGKGRALPGFEKRLMLNVPDQYVERRALRLIRKARRHFGTYAYDKFQHTTNGYSM